MSNIINWQPYLTTPNKIQFINAGLGSAFGTEFCISFARCKAIQALLNFKIEQGLISPNLISWLTINHYFNTHGQIDFSPRYIGILAGTTKNGTDYSHEDNAIKTYGLIPEVMFPNQANSYAEYTNPVCITQAMKDLGAEFLKRFEIIVDPTIGLDKSPLQCIVRFMDGNGILSPVGKTNHSVVEYFEDNTCDYISDSYWQEFKRYDKNKVSSLEGFIINEKIMPTFLQTLLKRGLQYVLLVAPTGNYQPGVYKILPSGVYADTDKQDLYDAGVNALKKEGKLIGISPDDFSKLI